MAFLDTPSPFAASIEPMPPWRVFFSFRGRISRSTWWLYGLALVGLNLLGTVLLRVAGAGAAAADALLSLLLLWPALAVSVKRWHDRDKSGWWVLITALPVIGWVWTLIQNGLLPGTSGHNRFGEPGR